MLGGGGRWVTYVGTAALIGSAGARGVLRRSCTLAGDSGFESFDRRLHLLGLAASVGLVLAAAARLYAHTYSIFGIDEPVTREYLKLVAFDTGWGSGWQAQGVAAIAAGLLAAAALGAPALRAFGLGPAAVLVAATLPMTGHAVAEVSPWLGVPVQAMHVLAMGLWIGTLAVTLALAFGRDVFHHAIHEFSRLAVGAVTMLAVTGVVSSWLYLHTLADLWTTAWGRLLLVKVGLFVAAGLLGAYNWRRLKPLLDQPGIDRTLRRTARVELGVTMLVLLATAFLVVQSPSSM